MRNKLILIIIIIFSCCKSGNNYEQKIVQKFQTVNNSIAEKVIDYSNKEDKDFITIKVPEEFKESESIMLDNIIDSIWYVPLETNQESLIKFIEKVIPFEDNLYILDMASKALLKFDSRGKFICQIGNKGKGPGEYLSPNSFEINNNQILVWDDGATKINYYDAKGNFIRDKKLGYRINHLNAFKNDKFICDIAARGNFHLKGIRNYKLIFCQPDWQIIGKADKYDDEIESGFATSRATITKFKDHFIYNPSYEYSIYSIDEYGIHKKYYIDFGTHKLPEGYKQNISGSAFTKKYLSNKSNFMVINQPVFETDKHLVTVINYIGQMIPLYYSKKSGKVICNRFYSHTTNYPLGLVYPSNMYGNKFIGYIEPNQILHARSIWYQNTDILSRIPENVRKFADKVKEDDNPVLVFFTLKEF